MKYPHPQLAEASQHHAHLGKTAQEATDAMRGFASVANEHGHWLRVSPNGCVYGSLLDCYAQDAGQAQVEFTPDTDRRALENEYGWTIEHVSAQEWEERAEPCLRRRCTHRS